MANATGQGAQDCNDRGTRGTFLGSSIAEETNSASSLLFSLCLTVLEWPGCVDVVPFLTGASSVARSDKSISYEARKATR